MQWDAGCRRRKFGQNKMHPGDSRDNVRPLCYRNNRPPTLNAAAHTHYLMVSPLALNTLAGVMYLATLLTNHSLVFRSRDLYWPIEASIQVTWPEWSNHSPVFRSRDQNWPIRAQYSGHVTSINQSGVSNKVTWSILTYQRSVFWSRDQYWPIRDQYSGHVTIYQPRTESLMFNICQFALLLFVFCSTVK